jgi:hypothetical protein
MTFLVAILCGLLGGAVSTRRELNVERPRLVGVLWVVVGAQAVVVLLPSSLQDGAVWAAVLATNAGIGAFLVANAARPGALRTPFALALTGWALNLTVIVLNHGMPVSSHAIGGRQLGDAVGPRTGFLFEHVQADAHTRLAWLGDVIPLHIGPTVSAISIGDVLISAAVALGVAAAVRSRRALHSRPPVPAEA